MAYKEYQNTTYGSGQRPYNFFNFNVAAVAGGSSVTIDAKFSNPFIILGGLNYSTNKFLTYNDIVNSYMAISGVPTVNSGLLRQQDTGGSITELGATQSQPQMVQRIFQLYDNYRAGTPLTTDGGLGMIETIEQPIYYSNSLLIEMLNTNFDGFAFPANTVFNLFANGDDVTILLAVKAGNNQPFFTLLP